MIYTLLGDFTIDWSVEWLGIVASAFILVSFLFSKQLITRIINMVGCLAFVIYATVYIQSFSTAFMNGALFIVHIVFIVKDYVARKKSNSSDGVTVCAEQDATDNNASQDTSNADEQPTRIADKTDEKNNKKQKPKL